MKYAISQHATRPCNSFNEYHYLLRNSILCAFPLYCLKYKKLLKTFFLSPPKVNQRGKQLLVTILVFTLGVVTIKYGKNDSPHTLCYNGWLIEMHKQTLA